MSTNDQYQINKEMRELFKELFSTIKEMQAENIAHQAILYSILQHHPKLDDITDDFMTKMDRLCSVQNPDRRPLVLESCQRILDLMLAERARRKSVANE
jgi:hypothetical protein